MVNDDHLAFSGFLGSTVVAILAIYLGLFDVFSGGDGLLSLFVVGMLGWLGGILFYGFIRLVHQDLRVSWRLLGALVFVWVGVKLGLIQMVGQSFYGDLYNLGSILFFVMFGWLLFRLIESFLLGDKE